jgi:hypothetical protein
MTAVMAKARSESTLSIYWMSLELLCDLAYLMHSTSIDDRDVLRIEFCLAKTSTSRGGWPRSAVNGIKRRAK